MKEAGKGCEYDAVIGVSGGCDSSFMLSLFSSLGVRLLAVHMDNGWNTRAASENMRVMTEKTGVPLKTVKVDQTVFDSLCRSMLYASTPDADIPNDLALLEVMSQAAVDCGCHYVLNGHSFRTEGSAPLGWTYMDGGYLEDVNRHYEEAVLDGFPHFSWEKQMEFWDYGVHTVRPLYHLDYRKGRVINELCCVYGWQWYEGLHAENIYTKFVGRYLWPRKFGIDYRLVEFSALVRSRQLDRKQALIRLREDVCFEPGYLQMVKSRLLLSDDEFETIMRMPVRSYSDFKSYLPLFRHPDHRKMFDRLLAEEKISLTFYDKYVKGV